ncbi:MAG: diacylglycerol kinase family lipid kinase [Armatimonadetes bacterium]|nr:diacylglycerol kinase family lipid kinase [Anaerolineae bacterium]
MDSVIPASSQFRKLMVIINPAAGTDRPVLGVINTATQKVGMKWDVRITQGAGDGRRLAQAAVADGFDLVAAHGGDGTVMEVADGLRGSGVPLAIFPGGTGNVTAGELGIPYDLEAAVNLIADGAYDIKTMDMAQTPDTTFLLRIGIGFEADMTKNTDQELKNRFGMLAYAFTALNELRTLTPAKYRITVDGEAHESEGISCMIANSGNMSINGLKLSQKIDTSDGLLDVVVFTNANLSTLINVTRSILAGEDSTQFDEIIHWQGREVAVEATPPQSISVDGEQIEPGRVQATILPGALKVIVPRPVQGN